MNILWRVNLDTCRADAGSVHVRFAADFRFRIGNDEFAITFVFESDACFVVCHHLDVRRVNRRHSEIVVVVEAEIVGVGQKLCRVTRCV